MKFSNALGLFNCINCGFQWDPTRNGGLCPKCFSLEKVGIMQEFDTGATRDDDEGKLDYEGFLSPLVLERYAQYMHKHRVQADGELRESDNWQHGTPRNHYMKSGCRHFMDWWTHHRSKPEPRVAADDECIIESICALIFNAMGYLHEMIEGRDVGAEDPLKDYDKSFYLPLHWTR